MSATKGRAKVDTMPAVEGWTITSRHRSAFVRQFAAAPNVPIEVEFITPTVVRGVVTDGTYLGRVLEVTARHQWDERKREWWSTGNLSIVLVNTKTGERYQSGWKSERISADRANDGVPNSADIIAPILNATRPHTIVTVVETPDGNA